MTVSVAQLGERALRRLGVAIVPEADRPSLTATTTAAAIATAALIELGVIAADETPAPADQALALDKVRAVHAAMVAQATVTWGIDAVPEAVREEYTRATALNLASSFGKAADPQLLAMLEGRVRKVAMVLSAPEHATQAVLDIHNHLAARGKVRWSTQDIPTYAEAPYVLLAANQLAPLFGAQANPADDVQASRALAQVIALTTSGSPVQVEYF